MSTRSVYQADHLPYQFVLNRTCAQPYQADSEQTLYCVYAVLWLLPAAGQQLIPDLDKVCWDKLTSSISFRTNLYQQSLCQVSTLHCVIPALLIRY